MGRALRVARATALAASTLLGASCDVYDASLLGDASSPGSRDLGPTIDAPPSDDAGPDAPVIPPPPPPPDDAAVQDAPSDAGAADGCAPRRPPERPVLADGPSVGVRWYALRHFRAGTGSSWRDIAYDLDGRCTSSESDFEDLECAPPPGFAPADDGPNGVDNTLGQTFWPLLTIVDPDYEAAIDRDMEDGIFGVLIRVAEWNGTGNDPVVDVAIVDALRGFAQGQDPMGTNPLEPPAWDGTDEWLATSRSFVAGDSERPLARDTAAYVVDGLIVAHPRDGSEVRISAQTTLTIKVTRGVLTARLTDGNRALGDVIFAGRMALDDVYDTLPRLDICAGSMRHTAITEALRRAADLTTGGEATPMLLCEAISVGIAFDGTLANVADVVEARPERDLCDGGEEHICETTCPTAEDGICDDGGEHSRRITCELGTDCGDCLPRPG